jgi:hypothetical protein
MTDKDALRAFSQGQELDQPTVRRLMRAGLVEADDITTLDTPGGGRFYKMTVITTRGQELLETE